MVVLFVKELLATYLTPTRADLVSLKRFLDDTATVCNKRIGERLAELLTTIHVATPTLFTPRPELTNWRISFVCHL